MTNCCNHDVHRLPCHCAPGRSSTRCCCSARLHDFTITKLCPSVPCPTPLLFVHPSDFTDTFLQLSLFPHARPAAVHGRFRYRWRTCSLFALRRVHPRSRAWPVPHPAAGHPIRHSTTSPHPPILAPPILALMHNRHAYTHTPYDFVPLLNFDALSTNTDDEVGLLSDCSRRYSGLWELSVKLLWHGLLCRPSGSPPILPILLRR